MYSILTCTSAQCTFPLIIAISIATVCRQKVNSRTMKYVSCYRRKRWICSHIETTCNCFFHQLFFKYVIPSLCTNIISCYRFPIFIICLPLYINFIKGISTFVSKHFYIFIKSVLYSVICH